MAATTTDAVEGPGRATAPTWALVAFSGPGARSIWNRAPRPGPSLAAVTRPPWASTSARTMASPMPEPPSVRERAVSTR